MKIAVLVLAVLIVFVSCAKEEVTDFIPAEYRDWARTVDGVLDFPIPGHESNYRKIFINDIGQKVTVEDREGRKYWEYPVGTIIVKEIYAGLEPQEGDKPIQLTVMIKKPDHTQSRGGWVWILRHLPDGDEQVIDYEFCFDCHTNANEKHLYGDKNAQQGYRDYVFYPFRKP